MKLRNTTDRYYLIFVCLVFILLIIGLGSYGFAETSEARYSEISREMFLSGDYLNPQLLGIFHFHKPPITYYITTLGYRIFGINEFGARFFIQVAIVLQLLTVYGLAKLLFNNRKTAFLSGLIYFAMPIVLISSRNLTTDAFLTTIIMAAIYCWQIYICKRKIIFLYLFYSLVGLALLTKGPVALLFILAYIVTYKLIFKIGSKVSMHHIFGVILCISIGSSWYLLVLWENPILWSYFLKEQLLSRINSNSYNRAKPFWFYLPIVLALLLPWWLSIIPNFKNKIKSLTNQTKEAQLLLISSSVLLVLFSVFSTKLILYILPLFWMVAIYLGYQLVNISQISRKIISVTYLGLISLIFLSLFGFWIIQPDFINISSYTMVIALLTTLFALATNYYVENEKKYKPAVIAAVFGMAILLVSTSVLNTNSSIINSTKEMMHFVNTASCKKNKKVLVYDYLLSSIPFYTNAKQITLKLNHNTTNREIQFQKNLNWTEGLWDLNDQAKINELVKISSKENTYLLVRKRDGQSNNLVFLRDKFNNNKEFPKWVIYYNN